MTEQLFSLLHLLMPVPTSEHSSSSWFCLPGLERLGDRPAYQHWQSKHACGDQNKRPTLQEQEEGRKEGRRERWTEQLSSRSRRGLERKRLALRHTNTYAAVLNSAHSWMLCHGVRGEAHQAAAVAAAAASFYDRSV